MTSNLIPATSTLWDDCIRSCGRYDIYHLRAYHEISRQLGDGEPYLFVFEDGPRSAVFPLVVREIPGSQLRDATSVYGYPGPLVSFKEQDPAFAENFQRELRRSLQELKVVSVFSRAHPLMESGWLLNGFGERVLHGSTVAIDLTLSDAEQLAAMNQDQRRKLRKCVQQNFTFHYDPEFANLGRFIELYETTMRRNDADKYYFFPPKYYQMLLESLRKHTHLFTVEHERQIIAATLVFETNGCLQYHLSGAETEMLPLGCMRSLLDGVRKWGTQRGCEWLHLGGGLGGRQDKLFQFKAGFSKLRFPFETIRIVSDSDAYAQLTRERVKGESAGFFPAYRQPAGS